MNDEPTILLKYNDNAYKAKYLLANTINKGLYKLGSNFYLVLFSCLCYVCGGGGFADAPCPGPYEASDPRSEVSCCLKLS